MKTLSNKSSRPLRFLLLLGALCLFSTSANAWDDDDDYSRHRDLECRDVVKKIRVNRNLTYTERGTACRSHYGAWDMVTDTRFPDYEAKIFFREAGRLVFVGYLQPRDDHFDGYWHGRDEVNFGYADKPKCKKRYKKHKDRYDHYDRHGGEYIKYERNDFFD